MKRATRRAVNIISLLLFVSLRMVYSDNLSRNGRKTNRSEEINVGVIVAYERWVGKMGLSCIEMALPEFYASRGRDYNTRLVVHARDSKSDVIGAASAGMFFLSPFLPFRGMKFRNLYFSLVLVYSILLCVCVFFLFIYFLLQKFD